jgi:hypothetical protein
MTLLNKSGIPEKASPESIPWTRYYQKLGVYPGWSLERFHKACRLLGETPHELCNSCCIPPEVANRYIKLERFPPYLALLFHMREQHFLSEKLGYENAT